MTSLKTVLALTFAIVALPAAFANNGTTTMKNEKGFEYHASPNPKSRAEVRNELTQYRASPEGVNSLAMLRVDRQFSRPAHSYALQGGNVVHTDKIPHDTPKPSASLTDAEKLQYKLMYGSGR